MNNIYVDELPKSCDECEHKQVTHKTKDGMYTSYACPFKDGKLAFGESAPMRNCPLKPLTDRLSEERKKVVDDLKVDIRSLFNSYADSLLDYCIWSINAYTHKKLYNNFKRVIKNRLDKVLDLFDKRIDQIERGVK